MDGLILYETPKHRLSTMVVAFTGWPDAGQAGSNAVNFLVDKLPATKFAEIDPEEFYDFSTERPHTRLNEQQQRILTWPANDFYYAGEGGSNGLLLCVGTEPNLKWRTFAGILYHVAEQSGVELVVSLGALLNAVPHTRAPRITGLASTPELASKAEWLGIPNTRYQGPTAIHSAFMDVCARNGIPFASIWGHSPHYVNKSPNPMVIYALLSMLRGLVDFDVDLDELRAAGDAFEAEVSQTIAGQNEITAYVRRLEQRYDSANTPSAEFPSPDAMVEELEEFLKTQRQQGDQGTDS